MKLQKTYVKNNQLTLYNLIKEGIELSSTVRATSTYYHKKEEQKTKASEYVNKLVDYDRSLPLLLSNIEGTNEYFKQLTIKHVILKGASSITSNLVTDWNKYELNVIRNTLLKTKISYVLRIFKEVSEIKNIQRLKNLILWYVNQQSDYSIIKYRNKFKDLLNYALGNAECTKIYKKGSDNQKYAFILDSKVKVYDGLFKDYYSLETETHIQNWFQLAKNIDVDTIYGLVSTKKNPVYKTFIVDGKITDSFKKTLEKRNKTTTDDQLLRQTKRRKSLGLKTEVDASKVSAEAVYKTRIETKDKDAVKDFKVTPINLGFQNPLIVSDYSYSTAGSKDSKNTVKVQIEHLTDCVMKGHPQGKWTSCSTVSNFAEPIVKSLKDDHDGIIIISDGYENYPYHGFLNDIADKLPKIIHLNPMFSSEQTVRQLGDKIVTLAGEPKQINTQLTMNLLEIDIVKYLEKQYNGLLQN